MDPRGERADSMGGSRHGRVASLIRFAGLFGLAFIIFAVVLLIFGKNPAQGLCRYFLQHPGQRRTAFRKCWSR